MGGKEKPYRKAQKNRRKNDPSPREIERELLRMQGLILCENCQTAYSLYQPRCPNCDEPNKTHYPAKV